MKLKPLIPVLIGKLIETQATGGTAWPEPNNRFRLLEDGSSRYTEDGAERLLEDAL